MNIALRIDIEAPPETVWALVEDPGKRQLWMPEVEEIDYPARYDRENPAGTHFRQVVRESGKSKIYLGDITAWEKYRLLALRIGNGESHTDVAFRLRPMGTGTRLEYVIDYAPGVRVGRILEIMVRPVRSRMLARHMQALRRLAENAAAGL